MSKCDLTILLDRENRQYSGGDKITGLLRVHVNAACACKALTITLGWRTHGKGNRDVGPPEERILFQGEWLPGKTYEYDFEFDVPHGPVTYHGKVLHLDWYLNARADIPWAIDPKAEEEILLLPGQSAWVATLPDLSALPVVTREIMKSNMGGKPLGCVIVFVAPFLLVGLGLLISGISGLIGGVMAGEGGEVRWLEPAIMAFFGLIFSAVPALVLFKVAGNRIAANRLGPVEVEVEPRSLRPGEVVTCRVRFQPTAAVDVNGVKAELVAAEVAISGSGTNQTTHRHELARDVANMSGARNFPPGKVVELEHTFSIPADATPSFHAQNNNIRWALTLTIEIPRWPNWQTTEAFVVHR